MCFYKPTSADLNLKDLIWMQTWFMLLSQQAEYLDVFSK